ncbi:MAG: hypothetical protein ACXWWO_04800 [Candidatus Limnocylindria bacterium]
MPVILVARFVSHPAVHFGTARRSGHRAWLGLRTVPTVYHRPRRRVAPVTISALRTQTSRFRFPAVGRARRLPARRTALPFGLSRGRRA